MSRLLQTRHLMQTLHALLRDIPAPDAEAMARAQQHIDGLLKPPGSPADWKP